jgi:predicted nucleic acid-binding protein
MKLRIYLDSCAYNRPYDDLSQMTVSLEAQAKLFVQEKVKKGEYDLVTSEMLRKEVDDCPVVFRKKSISDFINDNSSIHVGPANNDRIDEMAKTIMVAGVKYKDACHVASAILAKCDYLITTDKRLLKYVTDKIKLVNPIQFVSEMEDDSDDE